MTNTFIPYRYRLSTGTEDMSNECLKLLLLWKGLPAAGQEDSGFESCSVRQGLGHHLPTVYLIPPQNFSREAPSGPQKVTEPRGSAQLVPSSNLSQYLSFIPPLPHFFSASANHTRRWDPQMEGPRQLQGLPRLLPLLWTPECWRPSAQCSHDPWAEPESSNSSSSYPSKVSGTRGLLGPPRLPASPATLSQEQGSSVGLSAPCCPEKGQAHARGPHSFPPITPHQSPAASPPS